MRSLRSLLDSMLAPSLLVPAPRFLVDMRWMKQWKRYVGYDQNQSSAGLDSAHPGPLDNAGLFKSELAGMWVRLWFEWWEGLL